MVEFDDPTASAGAAGMQMRFDIPIFSGFGQFGLYILTLEKQSFCTLPHQRLPEADELVERSDRPGRDTIYRAGASIHTIPDVFPVNLARLVGNSQRIAYEGR